MSLLTISPLKNSVASPFQNVVCCELLETEHLRCCSSVKLDLARLPSSTFYNCATVQALGCGFGAEGLKQFKQFNEIKHENARSLSMESKTNDATLYNVIVDDLRVGVIDTPGLGDSKQDKTNIQRINNALRRENYINCVCLIINARQARSSASLNYILSEITHILPRQILNNVIIVFSNAANCLDVNSKVLEQYFGEKTENTFFIDNPYCRIEKVKAQKGKFGKGLQKEVEETSEVLTEMCEAIKDFPPVFLSPSYYTYYNFT